MKLPHECTGLEELRHAIDAIDLQIVSLLGKRSLYVKEAVKYKKPDKESIVAAKRQEEVIAKRREWAIEHDLDPNVIEEMYRKLMDYFVSAEFKLLDIEE